MRCANLINYFLVGGCLWGVGGYFRRPFFSLRTVSPPIISPHTATLTEGDRGRRNRSREIANPLGESRNVNPPHGHASETNRADKIGKAST